MTGDGETGTLFRYAWLFVALTGADIEHTVRQGATRRFPTGTGFRETPTLCPGRHYSTAKSTARGQLEFRQRDVVKLGCLAGQYRTTQAFFDQLADLRLRAHMQIKQKEREKKQPAIGATSGLHTLFLS